MIVLIWGSSPLTRGKRRLLIGGRSDLGLIPAHAGKTRVTMIWVLPSWAHPRSRGENPRTSTRNSVLCGSSPLTRGKLARLINTTQRSGLIPAHAGKTSRDSSTASRAWAHPRSRGENGRASGRASSRLGSSPLTRGKLGGSLMPWQRQGLIPAHAGKTERTSNARDSRKAHPRSRGENPSRFRPTSQ